MRLSGRASAAVIAVAAVVGGLACAPSANADTTSVVASADTYVHELVKTTNYGASTSLASYGSPVVTTFLRFAVPTPPAGHEVSAATLRLRTTSLGSAGSSNAQQVRLADDAWTEAGTLWANRPSTGAVIGALAGPTVPTTSYDIALDAGAVQAASGGSLSVAVSGTGTDSFWFTSRESSTVANRPTLVVETDSAAPPDTSPPSAPADLAAQVSGSTVGLAWTASDDDTAVDGYEVHRSTTAGFEPGPSTLVASTPQTSWSESRPAGTHYYRVVALDAAGNRSDASNEASAVVEQPPVGPPVSVVASADTYVHELAKTANYGASSSLAAYGSPVVTSYLRFAVPDVPDGQSVVSATLRLRTTSIASAGSTNTQQARATSDAWSEASTQWASRPVPGTVLGTLTAPTTASTTFDVSLDPAAVDAAEGGPLSLAITGSGTDSFWFSSRESSVAANRPTLVVQSSTAPPTGDPVVMAVGDVACAPGSVPTSTTCRHADVATAITAQSPDRFVGLGDLQYQQGRLSEFLGAGAYDSTFGAFKADTLPVVGNHELLDPAGPARGYFDYFYGAGIDSGPFGARPDGYYSSTIGAWTFIAINSECAPDASNGGATVAGGCAEGSPQYQWLQAQLAASAPCTVVAFHRPRWTTGTSHAPYTAMAPMWDLMASSGVDVVLSGHVHSTELFKPIGVSGTGNPVLDPNGIRSFVAGSGGANLRSFGSPSGAVFAALDARDNSTMGALRLTLRSGGYDWSMAPIAGQSFTNNGTTGSFSGTSTCH